MFFQSELFQTEDQKINNSVLKLQSEKYFQEQFLWRENLSKDSQELLFSMQHFFKESLVNLDLYANRQNRPQFLKAEPPKPSVNGENSMQFSQEQSLNSLKEISNKPAKDESQAESPSWYKKIKKSDNKKAPLSSSKKEKQNNTIFEDTKGLQNLRKILFMLFTDKDTEDLRITLSPAEEKILFAVLNRKFGLDVEPKNFNKQIRIECVKMNIDQITSKKRPEENYKFIFKKCIKNMKDEFERKNFSKKIKKNNLEEEFYKHYFQHIAQSLKVPLSQFYHPSNAKGEQKNSPKSINGKYIKLISQSEEFVNDLKAQMRSGLLIEQTEEISSKLDCLIDWWQTQIEEAKNKTHEIESIVDYVIHNQKCKLPWTIGETSKAAKMVEKLFS